MSGYLGNTPTSVPLSSADLQDSIITSAKIADGTIALADLSATGTKDATTFLRGDNSFATVSSDFVKLATATASSSSTISFDGYFSSTYKYYTCYYDSVTVSGSAAQMRLRYRQSNADVTTSSYKSAVTQTYTNGSNSVVTGGEGYDGASSIKLIGFSSYSTTTSPFNGFFTIYNPLGTTNHKHITGITSVNHDGSYHATENTGGFFEGNTTALSGFTLFPHTGNFPSGTFVLYGIK